MHNNIMAAGSRDRPPMLATGRYAQWKSRFLRYIDTRPNGNALRKCILQGPYTPSTVLIPADGESTESYYSRFYKMMNEMIRNNLTVATMQINVQFFQQIQPEWSRFVTVVKQQHELDKVSYHKLFDVLKQYQKEVNEIHAERIAKNANPLAFVAASQPHPDPYYQAPKSHKSYATQPKASPPTRSHATTRHKGKEIAKPITPPSKDTVGSQVVQQTGIQCFNCKEFEQFDWLADMHEEIVEQELEAHYSFMAKIHEVPIVDSRTDTKPLEQTNQNAVECDDERVALANLIVNLKLKFDENKKIQKKLKKSNISLAHELEECKPILEETSRTIGESNSIRDSCLIALQNKQTKLETYKTLNDCTVEYDKLKHKLNETLGLLAQKEIDIKEGLKLKAYEISVVKEKHDELVKQSLLTKSHYEGLVKEKKRKDHDYLGTYCKPIRTPWCIKGSPRDVKTLFAVIQTRFGGNKATKKTQKTLLKQMYENFSAPSTESLDSIFNRIQKIRNKPDLDTMSFDDLYNNFKIVEQEVRRTTSSSLSSQNMAFMSSPSSTNEVNTAYGVGTANTQVSPTSTQVNIANSSRRTVNVEETASKAMVAIDGASFDWSSRRTINVEEISSKAMVAIDGAGFDWSYIADDEVHTNMVLMAFSDSE
nr:hypothetical protein [Tanacetum cinerariifolium]